jgi:phosphoglycolate phosphatase
MLDNTVLYPGVHQVLDRLLDANRTLSILTNKPVRFSSLLIDRLGLKAHFQRIYGGNSFKSKKPDPYGLNRLIAGLGISKERTLMVGDSSVDIETAKNAGVASCGVTYGLQPETLAANPPEILLDEIRGLVNIVHHGIPTSVS